MTAMGYAVHDLVQTGALTEARVRRIGAWYDSDQWINRWMFAATMPILETIGRFFLLRTSSSRDSFAAKDRKRSRDAMDLGRERCKTTLGIGPVRDPGGWKSGGCLLGKLALDFLLVAVCMMHGVQHCSVTAPAQFSNCLSVAL